MILNAYLCDIDNEDKGAWLHFPVTDEAVHKALLLAEVTDYEFKFSSYETDIDGISEHLTEYEDIQSLNQLAATVGALTNFEREKYQAILQAKKIRGIDSLIHYAQTVKAFDLFPVIQTAEDLAHFHVDEKNTYNAPEKVKPYIKYQELGEKIRKENGGYFTKYGYLLPLPKKESEA